MRRALLVAAAVVAAAILWFFCLPQPRDELPAMPAPVVELGATEPAGPEGLPELEASGDAERTPVADSVPPPAPLVLESGDAKIPADQVEVHGTVVVVDERHREHAEEGGHIKLVMWRGNRGSGHTELVEAGAWRVRVPADVQLGVSSLTLGGRLAFVEDDSRHPVDPARTIELRARWGRVTRLHVRDAETLAELTDVSVVRASGWPAMDYPHPGQGFEKRVFVGGATSPLELPPDPNRHLALHVGAPGHAWKALRVECSEGGQRFVLLGPAGDLDVEITGAPADASTVLRVRDAQGQVHAEVPLAGRRSLALERLPEGEVSVAAEIGNSWSKPVVLAKGRAAIERDRRSRVELELAPSPENVTVRLGGTIEVPQAWQLESFLFVAELLDPSLGGRPSIVRLSSSSMERDGARPDTWRWHIDEAQAGRYELEVHPLSYSISLRVDAPGREDIVLAIPPPVELIVRVLDAATGAPAAVEGVHWHCRWPKWVQGGGLQSATATAEAGVWKLRAPETTIAVSASGSLYRHASTTVDLTQRPREAVLRVQRQHSVGLRLVSGGANVPWPNDLVVLWRPVAGGEERSAWAGGGSLLRLAFDSPGLYLVSVPEIEGYQPIPPQQVHADAGRETEHTIELVPRP
jgi:hypothetical protein